MKIKLPKIIARKIGKSLVSIGAKEEYDNGWLSIYNVSIPDLGMEEYTYVHEPKTFGKRVCIVPFRRLGVDGYEVLLRKEICPAWQLEPIVCAITGKLERGVSIIEQAKVELLEEAGYDVKIEKLIYLQACFNSKSMDTTNHLFTIDLSNEVRTVAQGDGTVLEEMASCCWVPRHKACLSEDPLVSVCIGRMELLYS